MTTIDEVERMARPLLLEHGLTNYDLAFDNARTRTGQCAYPKDGRRGRISISRPFIAANTLQAARETVLHEIAHALAGSEHGHDRIWKAIYRRIGGDGKARVDARTIVVPTGRYRGTCPTNPEHVYYRHRISASITNRRLYCVPCMVAGDLERGRLDWRTT